MDDEISIVNSCSVLFKCALVTMVWIVRGLYDSNRYILGMISCICAFDTHINHIC
jgi:hypothetical protein